MITFEQFITKSNGNYREFNNDGYKFQCVDLVRFYITEVLGFPAYSIPPAATAKQIFLNFPDNGNAYFRKIKNTPTNIPPRGAIIFWGYYPFITNWTGHVAIVSNANLYNFISFEQNYGNPSFCRYVNHNYRGVLGWLLPK